MTIRQILIAKTYIIGLPDRSPADLKSLADHKLHTPFIGQRLTIGLARKSFVDTTNLTEAKILR